MSEELQNQAPLNPNGAEGEEEEGFKKERKKGRFDEAKSGVTINSLMDAMFIILVFLLMNFAVDPLKIEQSEDLHLPASTTKVNPEATAAVTVTASGIVLNDKIVVPVKDGAVDKTHKGGDEQSMQIQPLFDALSEEAGRQENVARLINGKFEGLLTIIAHEETPYRLITEVLYTAGQAKFQKFKFAVVQGGLRANVK